MRYDRAKKRTRPDTETGERCEAYRWALQKPDVADGEVDYIRHLVIRLAQMLCERVWGKRFY